MSALCVWFCAKHLSIIIQRCVSNTSRNTYIICMLTMHVCVHAHIHTSHANTHTITIGSELGVSQMKCADGRHAQEIRRKTNETNSTHGSISFDDRFFVRCALSQSVRVFFLSRIYYTNCRLITGSQRFIVIFFINISMFFNQVPGTLLSVCTDLHNLSIGNWLASRSPYTKQRFLCLEYFIWPFKLHPSAGLPL